MNSLVVSTDLLIGKLFKENKKIRILMQNKKIITT